MEYKLEPQLTKLADGSKPTYEQLEESFLNLWDKVKILEKEIKRLNQQNADLKHTNGQLKHG